MSALTEPAPASSLRCTGCGYDLRGIASDGNCPECGKPVAASLAGDLLMWADARWKQRLHWGAIGLAGVCVLSSLLQALRAYLLARFAVLIGWPRLISGSAEEWIQIIAEVGAAGAIWLLTSADPLRGTIGSLRLTSVIRVLVGVELISGISFHLVGDVVAIGIRSAWILLDSGLGIVQTYLLYTLLSGLAARMPDAILSCDLALLKWLKPAAQIGSNVLELTLVTLNLLPWTMRMILPAPGYLVAAGLNVWAIFLLLRFARRLRI